MITNKKGTAGYKINLRNDNKQKGTVGYTINLRNDDVLITSNIMRQLLD